MNVTSLAQIPSDSYAVVGLLLTLVGLLATFFAVQLSHWLMSLLELRAKWNAHANNASPESQDALREARATHKGLSLWVVFLVTTPLVVFVFLTMVQSFSLLRPLNNSPEKEALFWSLVAFATCFGLLTLALLIIGTYIHVTVGKQVSKHDA